MKEIKKGIYKHYKGNEYKVLFSAIDEKTKEELVIYQDIKDHKKIWSRPSKNFFEKIEKNKKKIKRFEFVKEETNDFEAKYKRALADYQNLLKRTAEEKQEFVKYAGEKIITEIIPVFNNLKTSLDFTDKDADNNPWLEGLKYVIKQFREFLENNGVKEIKTEGENFDPQTMEAIEGQGDKIKSQVQAGYKLNGKVIVPARVILE